jgi:hypothetical protein
MSENPGTFHHAVVTVNRGILAGELMNLFLKRTDSTRLMEAQGRMPP